MSESTDRMDDALNALGRRAIAWEDLHWRQGMLWKRPGQRLRVLEGAQVTITEQKTLLWPAESFGRLLAEGDTEAHSLVRALEAESMNPEVHP
jgi:hypothetical protein